MMIVCVCVRSVLGQECLCELSVYGWLDEKRLLYICLFDYVTVESIYKGKKNYSWNALLVDIRLHLNYQIYFICFR